MLTIFDIGAEMSFKEKSTWIMAVITVGMSMAELSHFWIANVIYLAFVLATLLGSAARIVAYRRGFQQW